jgi:hypothetical protein
LPPDQYPTGVDCSCVSVGDPIACLAAAADAGVVDAGNAPLDAGGSASDASDASGG